MSILKKITDFLFEETEVEVVADGELEPIELKERTKKADEQKKEEKLKEKVKNKEKIQVADEREKESKEEEKEDDQEKSVELKDTDGADHKFVSIEIDLKDNKDNKDTRVERPKETVLKRREEKKEFSFSPVISPIYGIYDENQKKKSYIEGASKKHKKRKDPLNTVISPYFGIDELEEWKESSQKTNIEEEEFINEVKVDEHIEEENLKSVALEELLSKDVESEKADMLQISLFGDLTPVQKTDEKKAE